MATAPINTTTQAGLSPYVAEYATDMLGRGRALAETGYTPYGGNRVAGFTPLQQQAFEGIGSLAGYTPQQYTGPNEYLQSALREVGGVGGYGPMQYTGQSFNDPGRMQQFMSPYQQGVTDIAMREARRTSDIAGQAENAAAAQKGAFGGARHAIMGAERARNLQQNLGDIQTRGLQSAYDAAQKQFNVESAQEQQRQQLQDVSNRFGYTSGVEAAGKRLAAGERQQQTEQQRQYLQDLANRYGYTSNVDALKTQLLAGGQQQALEQKGLDIDYGNFERQLKHPYEQLQFQQGLMRGLPMTTTSVTGQVPKTDWTSTLAGIAGLGLNNPNTVNNLLSNLKGGASGISSLLGGISNLFGGGGGGVSMSNTDEALRYLSPELTGFF